MKKERFGRSSGFSLIELMIGLALGLFITGGLISLFIANKRSYNDIERNARLQENGRAALYFLTNDLRHANFWGQVLSVDTMTLPSGIIAGTCSSWASTLNNRFIGSNNPAADSILNCIGNNIKASTSAVAIKRVSNETVTSLKNDNIYLRSDAGNGFFFKADSATSAPVTTETDWEYMPVIYFIRTYSSAGDSIPTLCRVDGNPTLQTKCLVEGIEDLHIEYGIDSNPKNGIPETYDPDPMPSDMENAVTVKIYVLARDIIPDPSYNHNKNYQLGSKLTSTLVDNFHRAVFSTTIILPNQTNLPIR